MSTSIDKIALGITEDEIALGSHLIHFWQSDQDFERGVRFLELEIAKELSQRHVLDEGVHKIGRSLRGEVAPLWRVGV